MKEPTTCQSINLLFNFATFSLSAPVSLRLPPSVCLRFCAKFAVNLSAKTVQKLKVLIYNLQTFTLSMARCALLSLPLLDSLAPSLNCPLKCINIFYTILKLFLLLLSACLPTLWPPIAIRLKAFWPLGGEGQQHIIAAINKFLIIADCENSASFIFMTWKLCLINRTKQQLLGQF